MPDRQKKSVFLSSSLVLLVIGAIGGVVFWGGFNTFMEYTNTYGFCTSCHEMGTVNEEYKASSHAANHSGVPAICSDCHVPKPWAQKLWRKIKASNELYHKVLGTIDTPEKFEAKRLELAENVWASMREANSRECRNCHDPKTMVLKGQSDQAKKWHERELMTGKQTCIDCHKGIAHKLPDYVPVYDEALKSIKTSGGVSAGSKASVVQPAVMFKENKTDSDQLAKLDTGTEIEVIKLEGELAHVRLIAWDREQSIILYEGMSRPIQSAKLTIDGMDYIKIGKTQKDSYTELEWREITLEGWMSVKDLSGDNGAVWSYAKTMYESDCQLCHKLPVIDLWEVNEWPIRIKRMRRYTKLDLDRQTLVARYLQRERFALDKGASK